MEYCFVVDKNNKPLAPTKAVKGWYLVRKGRATLKSKYPMVIQLYKEVVDDEADESYFVAGMDDGSVHVGIAIVQNCPSKSKVVFKSGQLSRCAENQKQKQIMCWVLSIGIWFRIHIKTVKPTLDMLPHCTQV